MISFCRFATLVGLCLFAAAVPAQSGHDWSEFAYCLTCHGADGQGNEMIQAPAITGIEPWYLQSQLQAYRSGRRGSTDAALEMQAVAMAMDPADTQAVAHFVQGLRTLPGQALSQPGDLTAGANAYAAYCAACHGPSGQGMELLKAPAINRLSSWYLLRSMQLYRQGQRGGATHDLPAQQMAIAMSLVPDDSVLIDLVTYMQTLKPQGNEP